MTPADERLGCRATTRAKSYRNAPTRSCHGPVSPLETRLWTTFPQAVTRRENFDAN
jgi:hypothetical protein